VLPAECLTRPRDGWLCLGLSGVVLGFEPGRTYVPLWAAWVGYFRERNHTLYTGTGCGMPLRLSGSGRRVASVSEAAIVR
jgi:hypothetical protein